MSSYIPTYVVIPFYGQVPMTRKITQEFLDQDESAAVVLINNGPKADWFQFGALEGGPLIGGDAQGLNLHEALNLGVKAARRHMDDPLDLLPFNILLANNDIAITENFVARLSAILRSRDDLFCVSGNQNGELHDGGNVKRLWTSPRGNEQTIFGPCFMFKAELTQDPVLDESFFFWYGADSDFEATYRQLGYQFAVALDVHYRHLDGGSVTTKEIADKVGYWDKTVQDTERFRAKWDGIIPEGQKWLP